MANPSAIPPDHLIQQWIGKYFGCVTTGDISTLERSIARQAAEWGYKQRCLELTPTNPLT